MGIMQKNVLALILARGGSRRLPRKNILELGGKPLIAWSIEAALQSQCNPRVLVSTDNREIAEASIRWAAEVPFRRPPELAQDNTPSMAPILHALDWLEANEQYRPDCVMLLQPTSPFRSSLDIDRAIGLMDQREADAVVSVGPVHPPPTHLKHVDEAGHLLEPSLNEHFWRQDLPPLYALNGAIYLARREVLMDQRTWYTDQTYAYIMPADRSLDIDTTFDFCVAKCMVEEDLYENRTHSTTSYRHRSSLLHHR